MQAAQLGLAQPVLSEEMKRVVLGNLVGIAETYRAAGAEVQLVICSRGAEPSVTVIGVRQETGQPIIEVEFERSGFVVTSRTIGSANQQEIALSSSRRPGSITELIETFRGHMSVEFGFTRI